MTAEVEAEIGQLFRADLSLSLLQAGTVGFSCPGENVAVGNVAERCVTFTPISSILHCERSTTSHSNLLCAATFYVFTPNWHDIFLWWWSRIVTLQAEVEGC